jgi:hypothetical protein
LINVTLRGTAAWPTVRVVAIWNTNTAFELPCASKVRSPWVIEKVPPAEVYVPGASVKLPSSPAPGSDPAESPERTPYAVVASDNACCASASLPVVPGAGASQLTMPLTSPILSVVSVYTSALLSWNPVTKVEAPVVPILPLTTVLIPSLVMPALPPKTAYEAEEPSVITGNVAEVVAVRVAVDVDVLVAVLTTWVEVRVAVAVFTVCVDVLVDVAGVDTVVAVFTGAVGVL